MFFPKRIDLKKIALTPFRPAPRRLSASLPLLVLLIFSGCQNRTPPPADQVSAAGSVKTTKVSAPAEAEIFVDEAMLAKPYALIGGTVKNIGPRRLEKLSVEIELRRREGVDVERRVVSVEPADLGPGEHGKYVLKVLSEEWGSSRVVSLRSDAGGREVTFNYLPGAKRPPEIPPAVKAVANAPRQKPRPNGDEFINTPDTPIKVP
jgi:hypothetical protein